MDGNEKEKAQRLAPAYHEESQRKAKDMVRSLLDDIKNEPLPTQRSLIAEDKEMASLERRLAKLLSPLNKIDDKTLKKTTSHSQKKTKRK